MAGLSTVISVLDRATEPLRRMQSATSALTDSMRTADEVTSAAFKDSGAQEMERDLLDAASAADELADSANNATYEIKDIHNSSDDLPKDFRDARTEADNLKTALSGVLAVVSSIAAAGLAGGWLGDSIDLANQQQAVELQLKNVLKNTNADTGAFDMIKAKAAQLQAQSIYGDEAYIAGAAELSRVLKDADAVAVMMDTLSNYATGMSGGQELDASGMVSYAEQLSKALNGTYTMLERNNFKLTDAQKEIIEKGNDMQKALVISDVINQSWGNLSREMAELPSGKVTQFKNTWSDFREEIGERLQPAIAKFTEHLETHLPRIESLIVNGTDLVIKVIDAVGWLLDIAGAAYDYIENNWGAIGPIVDGIAIAIGGAAAAMAAYTLAVKLATVAHSIFSSTAVKGLTAVVGGISLAEAALTLLYDNVTVDGKNNTYSALGLVLGAFATVGVYIANFGIEIGTVFAHIVAFVYNAIAEVVNFFANAFSNPGGGALKIIVDFADSVLGVIQLIGEAWDELFGTDMAGFYQGLRDDMYKYLSPAWEDNKVAMEPIKHEDIDKYAAELKLDPEKIVSEGYEGITKYIQDKTGTKATEDLEERLKNLELPNNPYTDEDLQLGTIDVESTLAEINKDTARIASNTSNTDVSEILKLLRDISEREAINRFTTAEIKVDIGGISNNVNSSADAESITEHIKDILTEELATVAAKSAYGY